MKQCKIEFCDSTDMATRSAMCKVHHREYTREHYKNNKQYYVDKAKRANKTVAELVKQLKRQPCTDCGRVFPWYMMDFDHLNPDIKIGNVGSLTSYGKKKVMEEIAKCELLCCFCHRQRTAVRGGWAEEWSFD